MNSRGPKSILEADDTTRHSDERMRERSRHHHSLSERNKPDPVRERRAQREVAEYIESICVDLRMMARAARLESLAYFLEMSRIEASIQIELRPGPKSEPS
ncbi:hypothetical protein [Bosea sp. (in: a-proteobacteria)]|jgi:hypothetical protein|uniref:hypothetical protein n=1 Tax=Bosea sp. (in: a-proteobacteria) TaxID=1871050 RepID=UPI003F718F3D